MPDSSSAARLPRPARRLAVLALLLGTWSTSAPAMAGPGATADAGKARLTPAQATKIFPDMRNLSLKDRRVRIAILQNSERCLNATTTADGLRECFRQERSAMQKQRRANVSEMQQLLRSNGIQVPEGKRRGAGGRWGGQGGDGGGGMI